MIECYENVSAVDLLEKLAAALGVASMRLFEEDRQARAAESEEMEAG